MDVLNANYNFNNVWLSEKLLTTKYLWGQKVSFLIYLWHMKSIEGGQKVVPLGNNSFMTNILVVYSVFQGRKKTHTAGLPIEKSNSRWPKPLYINIQRSWVSKLFYDQFEFGGGKKNRCNLTCKCVNVHTCLIYIYTIKTKTRDSKKNRQIIDVYTH